MSVTSRYHLVVFDWDGTLADSAAIIAQSIQEACRDLDLAVPDDTRAKYVIGLGLRDAVDFVAPGLPTAMQLQLAERYRQNYLARDPKIRLFAGAEELLDMLEASGAWLAVATGKSRAGLDRALAQTAQQRRFHATRCADEGFSKPHPDMLLYLLDRLGVEARHALMIGDTSHDLEMARNAGVDAVGVSWGAHPAAALEALTPAACLHQMADLYAWLEARVGEP